MTATTTLRPLPGPKGMPVLGSLPAMRKLGVLDFNVGLWREFGDAFVCRMGPLRQVTLVDPDDVQHVLARQPDRFVKGLSHAKLRASIGGGILTLEGDAWKQRHDLLQPTYTPRNVRAFADVMLEETAAVVERWRGLAAAGTVVDINLEMTAVTMRVISRAIFGLDTGPGYEPAIEALHTLLANSGRSTTTIVDLPESVPTAYNRRIRRARATLREFIGGIVARRRSEGLQDDLLSMLMSARNAETGQTLSDDELYDEVVITVFAGHETTASLLTWVWYLLAGHPGEEAALHAELAEVLGGRVPSFTDLNTLPRTRMVLDETLRLYSPVPIMARDVTEDVAVGGWELKAKDLIVLLPYATHRHPRLWARPLDFHPEHFLPEAVADRPRGAFLPFGAGRRICIGKHFALLEAVLVLGELAQRFRLELAAPNDGRVTYIGVTRPAAPILMRIHDRDA